MGRKKGMPKEDYVAEEHGAVYNFFYSYKTHFYQLMTANLMFVVLNIPMLILATFMVINVLPWISPSLQLDNFTEYWTSQGVAGNDTLGNETDIQGAVTQLYFLMCLPLVMFIVGMCLVCIGPIQAGFNQLYRNLHRQEGIFLIGDFKDGIKSNWKQSTAAMFVGIAVTTLLFLGTGFYLNRIGGRMGTLLATVFIVFFFSFVIIQNMVYQQIVTLDLPLTKIYRNAILFSVLKFGPCLGLVALIIMLLGVIPLLMLFTTNYMLMGLMVFSYALFIFTFLQYMLAFFTGEIIDQYIVSKLPPKEEVEDDFYTSDEEDEDVVEDNTETDKVDESIVEVASENSSEEEEFVIVAQENQLDDE